MTDAPPPDLTQTRALLDEVIALVTASMDRIQAGRQDITLKPDGSPVTAADRLVEDLVAAHLQARLPGLTLIGEESWQPGQPLPATGFRAVLDPIDGTENFCSGLMEWGLSLSLWDAGRHMGSLLWMPELGARLMTGDRPPRLRSRIRGFSSSMSDDILRGMAETRESRVMGCAVYNLYNVARGAFARFTNPRGAQAWDLLAGLMLAREQGCDIELEGRPYDGAFLEPGRRYRVDIRHRYDLHPGQGPLG
jgi:myo-inositol-1(or 4)-monophosphatase